jgi:hypothetical protein
MTTVSQNARDSAGKRTQADVIREAYSEEARSWTAPVQGYSAGIPWPIHLEAYDAYCKKWTHQTALIDLEGRNCRGGFSTGELDMFVPGWREKISEISKLKAQIARLRLTLKILADQPDNLPMSECRAMVEQALEPRP